MAGLDLDALRASVETYNRADDEAQLRYALIRDQALAHLEELAALNDLDKAAVAYYIARLVATISGMHIFEISESILNTSVGYTFAAAKLVGLE